MSNADRSVTQTASLLRYSRSALGNLVVCARIEMGGNRNKSSSRYHLYLLKAILIGLLTFLWLEYAQMGVLYHWLFPIIVASLIGITHLILTEAFYQLLKPKILTVGLFWLISFTSITVSFYLVYATGICSLVCRITGSYCPTVWHASPPETLAVFFKTITIPWMIINLLFAQKMRKQEISKELAGIKKINAALARRRFGEYSPEVSAVGARDYILKNNFQSRTKEAQTDINHNDLTFLEMPFQSGLGKIAPIDIFFIAVEDHYCKLVFKRDNEIQNEYMRLSLKEAIAKLPASHFVQVHRSYVVNLRRVKQIARKGQAYQLHLDGCDTFVPASRHRAGKFLPKLKAMLN